MIAKVQTTINPNFKTGISEKTGKQWTLRQIQLEDGRLASGFDEVADGEEVELTQKGEYWNYKRVTQATRDTDTLRTEMSMLRSELLEAVRAVESKVDQLLGIDAGLPSNTPENVPEDPTDKDLSDVPF